jgi:hypothetical protein
MGGGVLVPAPGALLGLRVSLKPIHDVNPSPHVRDPAQHRTHGVTYRDDLTSGSLSGLYRPLGSGRWM